MADTRTLGRDLGEIRAKADRPPIRLQLENKSLPTPGVGRQPTLNRSSPTGLAEGQGRRVAQHLCALTLQQPWGDQDALTVVSADAASDGLFSTAMRTPLTKLMPVALPPGRGISRQYRAEPGLRTG